MARVAFIGLGNMGGGMAANLAKAGHDVRAFDLSQAALDKAKAMEMCLTGRMMGAEEAERSGLVARVVPAAELLAEALKTAEAIAAMPPLASIAAKEMVNAAFELPLAQGIRFERRLFHGLFGTEDQKEGMSAFVDKRKADWKGR